MHLEKYTLTWDAYSDHLRDLMKELMMNDDFADLTLVSEDRKYIKAHKSILSACSPVFKDILKLEQSSKPIVYLRGIDFSELESIMQFIYLGEATFFEERINEFLAVAKSLEIKELCNAETETNIADDKLLTSDPVISNDNLEEESSRSSHIMNQAPKKKDRRELVRVNGKYACNQCDYQAIQQVHLKTHIESKHEGVKYACDQCDYQASRQDHLKTHIESKHNGIRYVCDKCDYQASWKIQLKTHIESQHEGVKYSCDQCDYQAKQRNNLYTHIKSKH